MAILVEHKKGLPVAVGLRAVPVIVFPGVEGSVVGFAEEFSI